jgi:putative transposase
MSLRRSIRHEDEIYFLTLTVVQWIDLFSRKRNQDIIIESLAYCIETKGLCIYSWVIMSNHIHLIVRSENKNLSGTIRDMKKHTSKKLYESIQQFTESRQGWMLWLFKNSARQSNEHKNFQIWQSGNHAELLESKNFYEQKLNYIHQNPVRAGIVNESQEYRLSSAIDYCGGRGLLKIKILE